MSNKITNAEAAEIIKHACNILILDTSPPPLRENEILQARAAAIAALSPEPLPFPSWAKFENKKRRINIRRGHLSFSIDLCVSYKAVYACVDYGFGPVLYYRKFDFTEAGYNLAVAQLNAWLIEIINELMGGAK